MKELAEARLSVFVGGAGTSKTTLLTLYFKPKKIQDCGILLLAPTGKASGLYAAANFVDDGDDPEDVGKVYTVMKDWVESSGCFEADPNRNFLNHFIGTPAAAEVMGYHQQDLYMPILIKAGVE